MTKLLLDEKPLMVMPGLAVKIGLPESLFLQQLHYWLEKSTNIQVGHAWVYNTVKEWQVQFPFWSESTIRRIIDKLEKRDLLIVDNFNKLPIDQTKWYRINYKKLDEIGSESTDSRKRQSPSQNEQMDCSKRANGLVNLNTPLPESTTESTSEINNMNNDSACESTPVNSMKKESAFAFYEKNGFGILTPHVGEKMGVWIDDLNEELVLHALKISVENGVPRWSYAEKILLDWSNKKFTSVSRVEAFEMKRRQEQAIKPRRSFGKEDIVPEWFREDKSAAQTDNSPVDVDIDQKRAELQAKMEKMRKGE